VYEVARKAGVSVATVSRALNSPGQVSEETRTRVLAVIDQLGFYPKAASQKKIGRIGVITPFLLSLRLSNACGVWLKDWQIPPLN
jgi:DNA-binding LacI/PurR family transcriptional regulator